MLYVTTRSNRDPQTTHKALSADRGPDGGLYMPFKMPVLSKEELSGLKDQTFGQNVAQILELFFSCRLSGFDVDFCIGRNLLQFAAVNQRILVAQLWHNLDSCFDRSIRELSERICDSLGCPVKQSSWLTMGIRIAAVVGVVSQLQRDGQLQEGELVDISVPTGDFSQPMAVWYARQMGLPIGRIICSCNENSGVWELLHLGELRTGDSVVATKTPLADAAVPQELERLIHATLGMEETARYAEKVSAGRIYRPGEDEFGKLNAGLFSAVVSRSRLDALIPSVQRTCGYILGPYTALAYGGLMDYRAKTGENRLSLLLAERSPVCDAAVVTQSMRVTLPQLKAALEKA